MACCYIAASMIAFIIRSCDALDIDLGLQYNESSKPRNTESEFTSVTKTKHAKENGVTIVSISGMTCASCVTSIEKAIGTLSGVHQVMVNLALQEGRIFHDDRIGPQDILDTVENSGFEGYIGERKTAEKIKTLQNADELQILRESLRGLATSSTIIFCFGQVMDYWLGIEGLASFYFAVSRSILLLGVSLYGILMHGGWIIQKAAQGVKKGKLNMHTLITTSAWIGIAMTVLNIMQKKFQSQYYDSIMGILLIVTAGRYVDLLSRRQAANTFVGLYSLLNETASVHLANMNTVVPTDVARPGDEIIVDPYTVVPCDSYIIKGSSFVNEAIITGESAPKAKATGDMLYAGSRNGPGSVRAMIRHGSGDSFLSQLIRSLEGSLSSKASTQLLVDQITTYFVTVIFAMAGCAGCYTYLTSQSSRSQVATAEAIGQKMMTVLAAACPCALGLATPCAVMAGIDVAWRKGILMLQGGETMKAAQGITHVVLDKTGTLTDGSPTVTRFLLSPDWEPRQMQLAAIVCAAEEHGLSQHPFASAIFTRLLPLVDGALWNAYQSSGSTSNMSVRGGRGITCEVDLGDGRPHHVAIGNLEHMEDLNIPRSQSALPESVVVGSHVFVSVDGGLGATIVLQDTVRPNAERTIQALKSRSMQITMLTGDNAVEAKRISEELGIPVLAHSAAPQDKLRKVEELQAQGHKVAMIGDGINDSLSLAAADMGIMMAHGRSCLSAGGNVLILHSQLECINTLLDISHATMWQVSANITWALCYNIVAVGLALGLGAPLSIRTTPSTSAAMMSISSILMTASALVLRTRLSNRFAASL